jgi:hypothetical protein
MIDAGLLAWSSAENLGLPSVPTRQSVPDWSVWAISVSSQVAIKMNYANRTILSIDTPEQRQSNGVVAAQRNDSR